MKNKETGEFELLVGNGQIISGFFILALLLAVFFALGFIVARAKYQQEPVTTASASTPSAETRTPAAAPAVPVATPPPDTAASLPADSAEKPITQPAQDTKSAAKEPDIVPPPVSDTAPGTYWQVSCMSNQEAARALQKTIKDMGLPVSFSAAPTCTRILVGPYNDTANLARVKTQLDNAGLSPRKHVQ